MMEDRGPDIFIYVLGMCISVSSMFSNVVERC